MGDLFASAFYGFIIAFAIGWIMNVVKLANGKYDTNGTFVLRVVGIFFAPLGAVMGFIN